MDPELERAFLGALVAICRVDGEVNTEEVAGLRRALASLGGSAAIDEETLFFAEEVSPADLARAAGPRPGGPFRAGGRAPAGELAARFARAAHEVAAADGVATEAEHEAIERYAAALAQAG